MRRVEKRIPLDIMRACLLVSTEKGYNGDDAISDWPEVRGYTIDELIEYSTPECILQIVKRCNYPLFLSKDGQSIEYDNDVPLWIAQAVEMFYFRLLPLMQESFLWSWRRGDRGDAV